MKYDYSFCFAYILQTCQRSSGKHPTLPISGPRSAVRPDEVKTSVPVFTVSQYLSALPGLALKCIPTEVIEWEGRIVFIVQNDFANKMEEKPVSIVQATIAVPEDNLCVYENGTV